MQSSIQLDSLEGDVVSFVDNSSSSSSRVILEDKLKVLGKVSHDDSERGKVVNSEVSQNDIGKSGLEKVHDFEASNGGRSRRNESEKRSNLVKSSRFGMMIEKVEVDELSQSRCGRSSKEKFKKSSNLATSQSNI